jgi:hypothetical protein
MEAHEVHTTQYEFCETGAIENFLVQAYGWRWRSPTDRPDDL